MGHIPHEQKNTSSLKQKKTLKNVDYDDIYDAKYKINLWRTRILEDHVKNKTNIETALKFIDALKLYGLSNDRTQAYAFHTHRILQIKNEKNLEQWTREDVEYVVKVMLDKDWENETKRLFLLALKRLVHYAKHREIIEKKDGKDYCDEVKWITPKKYQEKQEKIKPQDLLTQQEFLDLIDAVHKISFNQERDVAAVYVLKGFAGRPGEFFNMSVGGVMFTDQSCTITSHGKTGQKTLALVVEYKPLLTWLQKHPERDNPDAWLWYADNKYGRMTYTYFSRLIKDAAKKAGIRKRVWMYLFRHTALTEVEREFGSAITNIYGNWSKGSKARERYIHLASSDQEKAILKKFGLLKEEEQESLPRPKLCPRCTEQNSPDKKRCAKCGFILDRELAIKHAIREQRETRLLEKRVKRLEQLTEQNTTLIKEILDNVKPKARIPA